MAYPTLPEGDTGIASGYTNDAGISEHGSVLFHDTFESYSSASDMSSGPYDNVYQNDLFSFPADPAVSGVGSKCLRIEHEHPRYNNADLSITGVDVVYVRCNMKLSSGFVWLLNGSNQASSAHAGIGISASYDGAGIYPNGTNHYLALFEPTQYRDEGQPGYLHTYCYHMNQGSGFGDHLYSDGDVVPSGSGWTPSGDFTSIPVQQPPMGEWFSVEMRCEANTPGSANGRVTVWVNGEIISDVGDIEFRSTTSLKWDLVQLGVGQGGGLSGSLSGQYVYFDNFVIATEYIGPVYTGAVDPAPSGVSSSAAVGTPGISTVAGVAPSGVSSSSAVGTPGISVPANAIDPMLEWIADNGTQLTVCSQEPTSYAEVGTYGLATDSSVTVGEPSGDPDNRSSTVPATALAASGSGSGTHWALHNGSDTLAATGALGGTVAITAGLTYALGSFTIGAAY